MAKTDVLGRLIDFLGDSDSYVRWSSVEIITALAKFGTLIYLACPSANRAAEDFRCKMVETDYLDCFVSLLEDWIAHQSSVEIVTTLAKFGTLIYFGIYKG